MVVGIVVVTSGGWWSCGDRRRCRRGPGDRRDVHAHTGSVGVEGGDVVSCVSGGVKSGRGWCLPYSLWGWVAATGGIVPAHSPASTVSPCVFQGVLGCRWGSSYRCRRQVEGVRSCMLTPSVATWRLL